MGALGIVCKIGHARRNPAGDLCAAGSREALQVGKVAYGHDARMDGLGDARGHAAIDKVEVGFHVVKILCNRRIGACVEFFLEKMDVTLVPGSFRMDFRVGGDGDIEMVAGRLPNERDQFTGMAQLLLAVYPRW